MSDYLRGWVAHRRRSRRLHIWLSLWSTTLGENSSILVGIPIPPILSSCLCVSLFVCLSGCMSVYCCATGNLSVRRGSINWSSCFERTGTRTISRDIAFPSAYMYGVIVLQLLSSISQWHAQSWCCRTRVRRFSENEVCSLQLCALILPCYVMHRSHDVKHVRSVRVAMHTTSDYVIV